MKFKKIVCSLILIICVFGIFNGGITAQAANKKPHTLKELRSELSSLKKQQSDNKNNKNKTQGEISSAKNSVANKRNEIYANQNKIESARVESQKLTKEIEDGKKKLTELVSAYQLLENDDSYYDYVFNSNSYEDLIYRYAVVEQVMDYLKNEIDTWNNKIDKNSQLKVDLEAREVALNNQIGSLEKDISKLGNVLDELNDEALDIDKEIIAINEQIKFYEKLGCKETQDLDECISVNGSKGFRRPTKTGKVVSDFGYRRSPLTGAANTFHSGTDISLKEGSDCYPIANGYVGYIVKKSSCGGNKVYIYHTVNGKKYTSTYMHLLDIKVSLGQTVNTNTLIGHTGGKTTGTRHGGYDACTTGAHLHLSISVGGWYSSYSVWKSHLQDARKIVNLPKSWSSR